MLSITNSQWCLTWLTFSAGAGSKWPAGQWSHFQLMQFLFCKTSPPQASITTQPLHNTITYSSSVKSLTTHMWQIHSAVTTKMAPMSMTRTNTVNVIKYPPLVLRLEQTCMLLLRLHWPQDLDIIPSICWQCWFQRSCLLVWHGCVLLTVVVAQVSGGHLNANSCVHL